MSRPMTCEEVRAVLPDVAEGGPRSVGPVQVHLSSCSDCTEELKRYRAVVLELGMLRDDVIESPDELLARLLADTPEAERPHLLVRVAGDQRVQQAALSLGGAVVGATAVGLLWWRAARRTVRV